MEDIRNINSKFTEKEWDSLMKGEEEIRKSSTQWLTFVIRVASDELDLRFRKKEELKCICKHSINRHDFSHRSECRAGECNCDEFIPEHKFTPQVYTDIK